MSERIESENLGKQYFQIAERVASLIPDIPIIGEHVTAIDLFGSVARQKTGSEQNVTPDSDIDISVAFSDDIPLTPEDEALLPSDPEARAFRLILFHQGEIVRELKRQGMKVGYKKPGYIDFSMIRQTDLNRFREDPSPEHFTPEEFAIYSGIINEGIPLYRHEPEEKKQSPKES